MHWLAFVAGAFLSWGVYGSMLHDGQTKLGSPMRAMLCVALLAAVAAGCGRSACPRVCTMDIRGARTGSRAGSSACRR